MTTDACEPEPPTTAPAADRTPGPHYEIRVAGHLGRRWAAWFDGMALTCEPDGTTVIAGPLADQAALHGVLQKLRDLGISLRSLTLLDPDTATRTTPPAAGRPDPTPPGATP